MQIDSKQRVRHSSRLRKGKKNGRRDGEKGWREGVERKGGEEE